MKSFLFAALFLPVCCFCQKIRPSFRFGGGYAFYTGPSHYGNINGGDAKNSLQSGFIGELTVVQRVNSFLDLGLGSSVFAFSEMNHYIPLYADIRVTGQGKYRFFSFLHPGYGFYSGNYSLPDRAGHQKGGFYIAYGAGVLYKFLYLQAAYHWLRFNTETDMGTHSGTSYGIAALTLGVKF
jgi:hypothetical protein